MIVRCDPATGEVILRDAEVFTALNVESPPGAAMADISTALGTPEADDVDHVWVLIDQIRELAGETTPEWNRAFDGMIEYAAGRGWTNEAQDMLLAHVEAI